MILLIYFYSRFKKLVPVKGKVFLKVLISNFFLNFYFLYLLFIKKNLKTASQSQKRKRVIILISLSNFGGVETSFWELVGVLNNKGCLLTIVVEGTISEERLKLFVLKHTDIVDLTTRKNLGLRTLRLSKILNLTIEEKVEAIVVSNSIYGYQLVPLFKKLDPSIRIIDWIHNHLSPYINNSIRLQKYIDLTIVVNRLTKNTIRQNATDKNIRVIHNGVREIYANRSDKRSRSKLVSFIGRLEEDKNPELFLEIATKLSFGDPSLRFAIVGEGSLRKKLEKKVKVLNLGGQIKFFGFLEHRDVLALLARTSLTIVTSPSEGSPLVILESMARGVPVIAPRVGGVPEIIRHGIGGYLVEYGDVQQYISYSLKLLADKKLYEKLSSSARERIKKYFKSEIFLKKMLLAINGTN